MPGTDKDKPEKKSVIRRAFSRSSGSQDQSETPSSAGGKRRTSLFGRGATATLSSLTEEDEQLVPADEGLPSSPASTPPSRGSSLFRRAASSLSLRRTSTESEEGLPFSPSSTPSSRRVSLLGRVGSLLSSGSQSSSNLSMEGVVSPFNLREIEEDEEAERQKKLAAEEAAVRFEAEYERCRVLAGSVEHNLMLAQGARNSEGLVTHGVDGEELVRPQTEEEVLKARAAAGRYIRYATLLSMTGFGLVYKESGEPCKVSASSTPNFEQLALRGGRVQIKYKADDDGVLASVVRAILIGGASKEQLKQALEDSQPIDTDALVQEAISRGEMTNRGALGSTHTMTASGKEIHGYGATRRNLGRKLSLSTQPDQQYGASACVYPVGKRHPEFGLEIAISDGEVTLADGERIKAGDTFGYFLFNFGANGRLDLVGIENLAFNTKLDPRDPRKRKLADHGMAGTINKNSASGMQKATAYGDELAQIYAVPHKSGEGEVVARIEINYSTLLDVINALPDYALVSSAPLPAEGVERDRLAGLFLDPLLYSNNRAEDFIRRLSSDSTRPGDIISRSSIGQRRGLVDRTHLPYEPSFTRREAATAPKPRETVEALEAWARSIGLLDQDLPDGEMAEDRGSGTGLEGRGVLERGRVRSHFSIISDEPSCPLSSESCLSSVFSPGAVLDEPQLSPLNKVGAIDKVVSRSGVESRGPRGGGVSFV